MEVAWDLPDPRVLPDFDGQKNIDCAVAKHGADPQIAATCPSPVRERPVDSQNKIETLDLLTVFTLAVRAQSIA
jgi:hypothetical protein